ncbi:uncharacterized protein A4U43_C07F29840 [Asparagus officinalis]|uniref:Uncharacterized protein n=1 Tax=Asparagus officinalis TaxID=4686 RepID=A0A5P1EL56_ASPOF|nr:uncharacterized protein A4U43_C07F29840 [Asparagus officinalis]
MMEAGPALGQQVDPDQVQGFAEGLFDHSEKYSRGESPQVPCQRIGGEIRIAKAEEAEVQAEGEVARDEPTESAHCQGKESAIEGALPTQRFGWPSSYHIGEIEEEK